MTINHYIQQWAQMIKESYEDHGSQLLDEKDPEVNGKPD